MIFIFFIFFFFCCCLGFIIFLLHNFFSCISCLHFLSKTCIWIWNRTACIEHIHVYKCTYIINKYIILQLLFSPLCSYLTRIECYIFYLYFNVYVAYKDRSGSRLHTRKLRAKQLVEIMCWFEKLSAIIWRVLSLFWNNQPFAKEFVSYPCFPTSKFGCVGEIGLVEKKINLTKFIN